MSESGRTHYEVLGVRPSATLKEMEAAYKNILAAYNLEVLGPFSRRRAEKVVDDANVAWAVLSNWDSRSAYNEQINGRSNEHIGRASDQPPHYSSRRFFNSLFTPFEPNQVQYSTYGSFFDQPSSDPHGRAGACDSSPERAANVGTDGPSNDEAASRYMETDTGTVVDIAISKWRLKLNLSPKFRFLNEVTELSNPRSNQTVIFQAGLAYNKNSPETLGATINELTVKIESLPDDIGGGIGGTWGIARLQTVFKESNFDVSTHTLTLAITAESLPGAECYMPWEFGFDFDFNIGVLPRRRGTCLIFNREEYPEYFRGYVGAESPEFELKRDKDVKANVFRDLASEKLVVVKYGNLKMWRLAAVGWRV